MMLRDGNDDDGAPDPKEKLRAELAKGNIQKDGIHADSDKDDEGSEDNSEEDDEDDTEGDEESSDEDEEGEVDPNETDEEKAAREAKEKEVAAKAEAKAQRKQDRMQRRFDKLVAEKRTAEAEIAKLKEQLAANPDQKLTAEEVESLAEAKAKEKLAEREAADLQKKFDADCDTLQKAALKADKEFNEKINEIAEDIGPIPSFMIGILSDMDNGGAVLAHVANDDELAEEIWKARPTKMTRLLLEISNKLADAAKPPKKQISKVPDPGTPVRPQRVISNVITEADTKNMDSYVAKRQRQMAEQRKLKFGN
jgi:hypothetical protein